MPLAHPHLPPAGPAADATTKDRILRAAEKLFAAEGFEKVSLRAITQAAEVNLASVNYHFGSKDALIDAIIENIVEPVNTDRLRRLDELEATHGKEKPLPLRDILVAFLHPLVVAIKESDLSEQLFFRLMGRCMSQPDYHVPETAIPKFREVVARFSAAASRTLPQIPPELVLWRLYFSVGTLLQSLMHLDALEAFSEGRSGKPSLDEILNRIVDYCIGGFEAPVSDHK